MSLHLPRQLAFHCRELTSIANDGIHIGNPARNILSRSSAARVGSNVLLKSALVSAGLASNWRLSVSRLPILDKCLLDMPHRGVLSKFVLRSKLRVVVEGVAAFVLIHGNFIMMGKRAAQRKALSSH